MPLRKAQRPGVEKRWSETTGMYTTAVVAEFSSAILGFWNYVSQP